MAVTPEQRLALLRAAIQRNVFRAADKAALAMEAKAVDAAPKSLGELARRIHGQAVQDGAIIRARLTVDSPYGKYVEEGTGPAVGHKRYMPPPGALRLWVQRTLRPPAIKGDEERVIEAVENAVRWKIYLKGTKPQPFARPAYEGQRQRWKPALLAAVQAAIKEAAHA